MARSSSATDWTSGARIAISHWPSSSRASPCRTPLSSGSTEASAANYSTLMSSEPSTKCETKPSNGNEITTTTGPTRPSVTEPQWTSYLNPKSLLLSAPKNGEAYNSTLVFSQEEFPVSQESKAFGSVVREKRNEYQLSQEELAFRSGVNRTHLVEIEKGKHSPSPDLVFKIASGLGISASSIVSAVEKRLGS